MRLGLGLILTLMAALPLRLAGQEEPTPAPGAIEAFGAEASRVLLDVVVRDGKDTPVTDLQASDFEVYEDGERQQVDIFQVIRAPEPAPGGESGPPGEPGQTQPETTRPAPAPLRKPDVALIAFVFDRLSPDARNQAERAALTYLDGGRRETDRVGVFLIDLSLITLQSYTSDADLIREAIKRTGERATSTYASDRGRQRDIMATTAALEQSASSAGGASGPGGGSGALAAGSAAGGAAAEAQLRAIELRMSRSFEVLERDQQGYATTNGLLAVVNSLRLMPGRKTVVFFSEGLAIPVAVQAHFRSVISEANRANVSVYAMDVAGLRTDSVMAETRREMIAAANEQARQRASGRAFTGGAMSKQLERNEDLLRLNPHSGLGQLAEDTGGFLVHDTNDLKTGFRRINADMRFYYLLAYEPTNQDYDGSFRKIEVKVQRGGVKVRARKGYVAIRQTDERPVLSFEGPALARLDRGATSDAFPTWAGGLSFPEPERPGLAPILVDVPGNVLKFTTDEEEKTYLADLVIMARIKDPEGRVVDRLSQHYRMTGPLVNRDAARAGEVLFYREAELEPGRYTVEAIAYDGEAEAASVRNSELVVPEPSDDRLRLSSVMVVKRVEQIPESERDPENPLTFGEILLYPSLGEPISKAARSELAFFFKVYAAITGADAPRARIAVLRSGAKLADVPIELPAPDASGRIQHVLGLPLAQFPAGSYEIRVTVQDDRGSDMRSAAFTVEK